MNFGLDQILPSLQALGLWSYWIIGAASALEAFFITGIFIPGTLVVDAGGMLVERGLLDFFDLVWFVAIGSFLGGELSYRVGKLGARGLKQRLNLESSSHYRKAEQLFQRRGGVALVIGRFLGPVSGLVSFAAAISGMEHRRFVMWNLIGAFPYALAHVSLGFFLGGALFKLGPFATRVALFGLGITVALGLLWYLVVRIERQLPFVLSVLKSTMLAIAENPDVRAWAERNPRKAGFMASRFDTGRFYGLIATLLGTVFIYIVLVWAGTVFDFLMAGPMVQIDLRLANLVHAFWSPALVRVFTHVTALGDWRVVGLIYLGIGTVLLLRNQIAFLLGLTVALAGNVVLVAVLKAIFQRPRPELAYFVETSGSFPSGHAAISVAFYGMLFYIAWRQGLFGPLSAIILAVTTAFLIGLSRLFLIEHYLSDVLNGYLVGAMWLVIGIAVTEWWQEARKPRTPATGKSGAILPTLVLTAAFIAAGWINVTYDKPRNRTAPSPVTRTVQDLSTIFRAGGAAPEVASIFGTPLEPVNLVLVAKDAAALKAAMKQAGWVVAEQPGPVSLTRAAWAAWTRRDYGNEPVTPYFWDGRPNDYGFKRPAPDNTLRKRHHARFWNTPFATPDGARIFVGAASFDNGLDWGVIRHDDPNIDAERDRLVADLKSADLVRRDLSFALSPPDPAADTAGASWLTDGKAVIMWIK